MRLSDVLGVSRNVKKKTKFLSLGALITGFLSVAFGIITFYGQNAGNFVMAVDQDAFYRGIELSTDELFRSPTSRLMTDPVVDARDITYSWIKFDEIKDARGHYRDPDYHYIAYTFFMRNNGLETVNVSYNIRITDVYKGVDEAVRFLVIEDDTIFRMYQKPDQRLEDGTLPEYFQVPQGIPFLSETMVARHTIENFKPGEVKKFSIVIWLEGQDPDTNDDILGGMIKAHMNFMIVGDA